MSTPSNHENYTSDFLELEPVELQKTKSSSAKPAGVESWDVDKEINSLFDLIGSNSQPDLIASKQAEQQLLQKITSAETLLTDIHQKSQLNANSIQQSLAQAEVVQGQTEKLAKYTKQQAQQVQEMLQSFEQIRQEVVTALDKFGDFQQLKPMMQQMEQSEQSLTRAHEQLHAYQSNIYGSLQRIQQQVESRSTDADTLLKEHKTELTTLLNSAQVDRQQLTTMQGEVAEQIRMATELRNSLLEQSAVFQHNITDINSNFTSLSESVQHEKQQFYQLTAEMINKADATRSKFAEIAKQVNKDWEAIQSLKFEMEDLRTAFDTEAKDQFQKLNQRYDEMVSTWGDIKKKQNHLDQHQRLHQKWLVGATSAIAILFLGVIVLLLK